MEAGPQSGEDSVSTRQGNWKYLGALTQVFGDSGRGGWPGELGLVGHDAPPAHTKELSAGRLEPPGRPRASPRSPTHGLGA